MISDFKKRGRGARFSKIGESCIKKPLEKEENWRWGRGVKNDPKKSDIIYGRPLRGHTMAGIIKNCGELY